MGRRNGNHKTAKAKISKSLDGVRFRMPGSGKTVVVSLAGLKAKIGDSLKSSLVSACNGKVDCVFRDRSVVFKGNGKDIASVISRISKFKTTRKKIKRKHRRNF